MGGSGPRKMTKPAPVAVIMVIRKDKLLACFLHILWKE